MRFNTAVCLCVVGAVLNITGSLGQTDVCGKASLNTRISGGGDATPGSWPWQVSLRKILSNQYCGGSLISKRWVLTSAYCIQGVSPDYILVYLGRQNQAGLNPNETNRRVSQVYIHSRYDSNTKDNDIALVQLLSSVNFTDYIKPVCLAGANSSIAAGTKSWLTGWGTLVNPSDSVEHLQQMPAPIVNDSVCQQSCFKVITDNMICAGELLRTALDACQGDSGAPLVGKKGSQWIQTGIMSFGPGCVEMWCPGVYTRVSKYHSWIKSQITSDQPGFIDFASVKSSFNRHTFNSFLFCLSFMFSIPLISLCISV